MESLAKSLGVIRQNATCHNEVLKGGYRHKTRFRYVIVNFELFIDNQLINKFG